MGSWTASLAAILAGDPEAAATASHIVKCARRENFFASQQGLCTEVRCPEAHPDGWNVACRRVVLPNTTPIPHARYLDIKHCTNKDLYIVAPAFQADAWEVLDNSLFSWAATVPPESQALAGMLCAPRLQQPFTSAPPCHYHGVDDSCGSYAWTESLTFPITSLRTSATELTPTAANSDELYHCHSAPALHQICLEPVRLRPSSLLRAALWLHTEGEAAVTRCGGGGRHHGAHHYGC